MTAVPMPEPTCYFSHHTDMPMFSEDEMRAYGDARAKEARAEALEEAIDIVAMHAGSKASEKIGIAIRALMKEPQA